MSDRLLEKDNIFVLPANYVSAYQGYFTLNYIEKRFKDDGTKFMLMRNPSSFSDTSSLELTVRPTKFSHVQYYRDNIAILLAERSALIEDLVRGTLLASFPHAFCMHMVVVTSDTKLLITRRSPKVSYFPGFWSASAEEQLATSDFEEGDEPIVLRWGRRLLFEELGLGPDSYHTDNLRILSVFVVESDVLNTSLCAYAVLNIDSKTLDNIIRAHPRTDYEFTEWTYLLLERKEILSELFQPSRNYHPTTGYRLLQAFYKNFGMPKDEEIRVMFPG